ncbi:VOC family protein [Tepidicaulis sp.]|uniref:VOC family protein n=1 Tax=Tepidicaulis sp. TaxID=1920809 RepID=UPI003B59C6D3
MSKVKTHMMFQGEAENAVRLYASVFSDFQVGDIERYVEGEPGPTGAFKTAPVSFAGHELIIFDSPPMHDFTFTPSISLYVDLETAEEIEAAFAKLSEGGQVMMPLDDYGFSQRFGWLADRYGVSWQLNLPA